MLAELGLYLIRPTTRADPAGSYGCKWVNSTPAALMATFVLLANCHVK